MINIFSKIFDKESFPPADDNAVLAVCSGELIPPYKIKDKVFASEMMGKIIAIEPTDNTILSPVNGRIEVLYPTGHAFAVKANNGTGYLIHIGIDTVNLNCKCFKVLKKQGDSVKAGEPVVKVNFKEIEKNSLLCTTMIIVVSPIEDKNYEYIDYGHVEKGQIISR